LQRVPEGRPDWFRMIVETKTRRSRAQETRGIETSQLDLKLIRPTCRRRCNPARKPSLDLNATMKQAK